MKIRSPFLIRSAAILLAFAMRRVFGTLKIERYWEEPGLFPYDPTGDDRYLYCIWHDAILGVLFCGKTIKLAGLASLHADGDYVAHAMEALNIPAIRGSSGRGGVAAIREIQNSAKDMHVAITTDGPRGPRREVKDGMIFLASKTGRPIVPVAFDGTSAWRPHGKWTDLLVPKPFSKVIIATGTPIHVPKKVSREEFAAWRETVQSAMDRLDAAVQKQLGRHSETAAQEVNSTSGKLAA